MRASPRFELNCAARLNLQHSHTETRGMWVMGRACVCCLEDSGYSALDVVSETSSPCIVSSDTIAAPFFMLAGEYHFQFRQLSVY